MSRIALLAWFVWSTGALAAGLSNVDKKGVALQGYDPVSYFRGAAPQKGDAKFSTQAADATYLFASEANRQEFLKNPQKYEPQFGGWCAYAVAEKKEKAEIDPKSFVIQDGRLLLFYNGLWGDTREKWLTNKKKDAKAYLQEADTNWPAVKNKGQ